MVAGLRARLLLLAIDADRQDDIAECIDEWESAGLLANTFLLDLKVDTPRAEFLTAFPGDPTWKSLDAALNHLPWNEVTVVSIRPGTLGTTAQERVGKEESLVARLREAYPPLSEVKPRLFSLSVYQSSVEFQAAHLPRNFTGHLIHEPTNFVDERLPRQPLGTDTASTLAFTAVVAGGGLRSQRECPVGSINDYSLDATIKLRFIRALGRAASAGFLLDRSIRRIIGPESSTSLVETPGISVVDDDPRLLSDLGREIIKAGRFHYQKTEKRPSTSEVKETGFFEAIRTFFSGFGFYLGKAVETTVKSRIESRARAFLDAFQELLFGDDSTVRIRGTTTAMSPEHALEELARRAAELKDVVDFGRIESRPIPTPDTWRLLSSASLSALDGADIDATRCLVKGGVRTVFRRPAVLGPAPSSSDFHVARESLERVGIDLRFVQVDALDFAAQDQFESALREARLDSVFAGGTSSAKPEDDSKSRLRVTKTREDRIADRKDDPAAGSGATVPVETVTDLRRRFETWRSRLKSEHSGTLLWDVSSSINEGIRAAKDDYKFEDIKRISEEAATIVPPEKKSLRSALSAVGILTGVLIALGFLLSRLGIASLIGLPIVLLFFVIWLFGTAIALGQTIIRQAIALRKFDFECKKADSELDRLIRLTLNAVREFSRLTFIQRQLTDWSRSIREVAHAPFGRLTDVDDSMDRLPHIPHPPQFPIARFLSRPDQISAIDREVWLRILRIGYLSDGYRQLRARWSDEYNMHAPGGLEPESDTGPLRALGTAERRASGRILNPRSDLAETFLRQELRASVTEGELESIVRWFSDHRLSDLFSKLDHVETAHHAFDKFSPEEFLLGLTRERRAVDFDPNSFSPHVDRRVDNVEHQLVWNGDGLLKSFPVSPERPLHFVTWALHVGYGHALTDIVGGRAAGPAAPAEPDRPPRYRS